ncbi:hypothetical protein SAMN05216276_110423 [Streptosporangium subroseum]|uniref:Peptidase inhibitor family I36 n=1 Tax=Streptosporangium subroseum TaxID=106412 RepID=A0A239PBK6_9ACTN|nr:hypothetical protein [Streptosporangium subroseum]SNT63779.1 hypothetical protein SAMN05216276_110423 [Streptosporangium subroseum]
MRKLRSVLVGTALAGALAAGIAAAPAQAATATTAGTASVAQAQYTKHWFSGSSSFGRGESRGDRSDYRGYWYYSNGRYYFDIEAWDHDRDRQNTYVDFSYHDNGGWHTRRFSTGGHGEWKFNISARSGFDGFRTHIGEGNSRDFDWGNYYGHSF